MPNGHKTKKSGIPSAEIRVVLPLPLGLAGDLMEIIGTRYPGTRIITDSGHPGELVLRVPNPDFAGSGPLPDAIRHADDLFNPSEGVLVNVDDEGFDLLGNEEIATMLVRWAKMMFLEFPGEDAIEFEVEDAHTNAIYLLSITKPGKRPTSGTGTSTDSEDPRRAAIEESVTVLRELASSLLESGDDAAAAALDVAAQRVAGL